MSATSFVADLSPVRLRATSDGRVDAPVEWQPGWAYELAGQYAIDSVA